MTDAIEGIGKINHYCSSNLVFYIPALISPITLSRAETHLRLGRKPD